jgi:radical SAM superfamily enzyme YgiQ (UPF0313 family)
MRRVFLALAGLCFLFQVSLPFFFSLPIAWVWPPMVFLGLGASVVVLLETRGLALTLTLLATWLAFGWIFPRLATTFTQVYGFAGGKIPWLLPLVWTSFLALALALHDQLRWLSGSRRGRYTGPWVAGLALGALEMLWDPLLLSKGLIWSRSPSFLPYPGGYTPGWPIFHFFLGWAVAALANHLERTGRIGFPEALKGGGLLTLVALPQILGAGLHPGAPPPWPPPALFLADLAGPLLLAAVMAPICLWLLPRFFPREHAQVLLTTALSPIRPYKGGYYPLDFFSSRSSRDQGPWTSDLDCPYLGAHILGQNLKTASVVLEFPSEEAFEEELREVPYEVVGIGFMVASRDIVRRMCEIVRRVRPTATIVLGGYGVVCVEKQHENDLSFDGLVDEVCHGEGITFMRRLLGEEVEAPRNLNLPPQRMYPLGLRPLEQRLLPLVVGFGCDKRCGFCGTSAFFSGKNVRFAEAKEIAATIKEAFARDSGLGMVAILDEDYLQDQDRAREVGRLLWEDPDFNFSRLQLSVFSTAATIDQYSPEELAGLGVSYVWIGAESKFTPLKKLGAKPLEQLLGDLEEVGISATISWILGFDFQTPENIQEDVDWVVSLPSVTAQISLLGPIPGTALYRQLQAKDRLFQLDWQNAHLYEECMEYEHFAPGEAAAWIGKVYTALYLKRGPSMLRTAEVWLKGYRSHKEHEDPKLRALAKDVKKRLHEMSPVLHAMARLGEIPDHRQRAAAWVKECQKAGIDLGVVEATLGWGFSWLMRVHWAFLKTFGLKSRQPRIVRTVYRR